MDKSLRRAHKEFLLEDDRYKLIDKARRAYVFDDDQEALSWILENFGFELLAVYNGLSRSWYKRRYRVRQKTKGIICSGKALFLTLTFRDEVLDRTTPETRRRYVARWLKSVAPVYCANIDYGDLHEREHYHAIAQVDWVDLSSWKYGFSYAEQVKTSDDDLARLSKYVVKLTKHAMKDSVDKAKRSYL